MRNKKGSIAILEIFILVVGVISVSFIMGSQVGIISAQESPDSPPVPEKTSTTPNFNDIYPNVKEYSDYITANGDGSYDYDESGMKTDLGNDFYTLFVDALASKGVEYITDEGKKILLNGDAKKGITGKKIPKAVKKTVKEEAKKFLRYFKYSKDGGIGSGLATLASAWIAYAIVKKLTSYANERNADPINQVAAVTTGVLTLYSIVVMFGAVPGLGWMAGAIVLGLAAIKAFFSFQVFSKEIIIYAVTTWQAPDGGRWCKRCNDLPTGCSEYQCRSFGKGCSLINNGTEYQKCIWKFQDDRTPPILSPLDNILEDGLTYQEFNITSPPERGMKIINPQGENKCIPAFTSLTIGLKSDEDAICRWDYERKEKFDEMSDFMNEGGVATINHTLYIPNSATASAESLTEAGISIEENRKYGYFVKCKDINGNENPLHFLVEFCVESGPDTNAPEILGTNYLQDSYIQYNTSTLPLQVYTNEPADCKWDHDDLEYENMQYNMSCSQNVENYLFGFSYGCVGELSGFKDKQQNDFYIRCKDKPWWKEGDKGKRYKNRESYALSLKGTEPLVISSITANGEASGTVIKGNSDEMKVKIEVVAFAGADHGRAKCSYISGGSSYNFYNDGNSGYALSNTQRLWLTPGDYSYGISCSDAAGNIDTGEINFTIQRDSSVPVVVRILKESSDLKIITDEEASCVYDIQGCDYNFEEGLEMTTYDSLNHFIGWNSENTYYIKCEDAFGNRPTPGTCSIEIQPFEV